MLQGRQLAEGTWLAVGTRLAVGTPLVVGTPVVGTSLAEAQHPHNSKVAQGMVELILVVGIPFPSSYICDFPEGEGGYAPSFLELPAPDR